MINANILENQNVRQMLTNLSNEFGTMKTSCMTTSCAMFLGILISPVCKVIAQ